jgi:hypothetical protein
MNLEDKRESLKSKQLELKDKVKQLDELSEKVKSITVEDAQFLEIQDDINSIQEAVLELKSQIDMLNTEVTNEEKSLEDIADKVKTQKEERMKGGTKMEYLKTKEALVDFANLLQRTGGREALKEAWGEHLHTKGISNPDVLMPQALITSITDAFEQSGTIFATFNYTGLTMWKSALNTNVADATARAKGHKVGTTKAEQVITLTPKEIRAQYIYKYITLDREVLRETQDTGALLRYVLAELPQRIVMEIERAAMIGDGREAAADDKINSYEAIARTTGDVYVSVQEASQNDLLSDLVTMDSTVTAPGSRYLVISRPTLAKIKLLANNGGLIFPIGSDIAAALGYTAIFTPDWMTVTGAPVAIEYVGAAYKTVGDNTMDSYDNFILAQNKNEFLMEIYSGGALDTVKSAAVLTPYTP